MIINVLRDIRMFTLFLNYETVVALINADCSNLEL